LARRSDADLTVFLPRPPDICMSFASRIKKLASETAIYGLSSIVGRMVNFLLVPFYTNVFEPDRYGVVITVFTAFVFLNIAYTYGMESAYLKYASGTKGREQAGTAFSSAILSLLASSALLSMVFVLLPGPIGNLIGIGERFHHLLYYAAAILAVDALAIVPFAELRLANRPWTFAAIKLLNIAVNVGLNVYLILVLGWGIEAIFVANLVASASTLLLLSPVIWKRWGAPSRPLWAKLLAFGLPFVPGGLGYALADRLNIFFLARMDEDRVRALYGEHIDADALTQRAAQAAAEAQASGASAAGMAEASAEAWGQYVVGAFGTAWKLGIFLVLVVQMFRYAWQPFFLQHAEDPDAKPLFARVFTLLTAGLVLAVLSISFLADDLVQIPLPGGRYLISSSYWFSLSIVPLALLAYFFQGWYYAFSAGLYITEKTRYLIHATMAGSVVSVVLNIALTPRLGMVGAAWATTAAYAVMAGALYFLSQRFFPMRYDWGKVAAVCGLGLALFALWFYVPALNRWWIEIGMIALVAAALVPVGIIPVALVRRLARRG
jgi:O-antigen/teichoic acid export membrane protein